MAVLQQFKNSASTSLAADLTLAGTSLSVRSGTGNLFPALTGSQFFYTTLISSDRTKTEIVKVTARATDIFTIVRAQDGTASLAFSAGDTIELRVIAADMTQIKTDIDANVTSLALKASLDSPTFTGTPAAPTPVQFDNTTKLATMAALVRSGWASGVANGISGGTTLTVAYSGKICLLNGTPGVITMPSSSAFPADRSGVIAFWPNVNGWTINRAGSDNFYMGATTLSSVTLNAGDTLLFVSDGGTGWIAFGGNALLPYSPLSGALNLGATGQIAFPATQNPSAGANTLDDYEEGTYTPTVTATSGTFTSVTGTGTYTKIGRVVHITMSITITTIGTASGGLIFTLPFTPSGFGNGSGRDTTGGNQLQGTISGTTCTLFTYNNTFPGTSGTNLQFSGTYFTA